MIKFSQYLKEEYERVGNTQYGSNPGGVHIHKETGDKYYIKFPRNPEQAKVEVATAKIYEKLGIKTLKPDLVNVNGKIGVRTKWLENHKPIGYGFRNKVKPEHGEAMAKLYHGAVITGNRDAVGLEFDNILHSPSGDLLSVDQGGSMHFRAMGGSKDFHGNEIGEFESMRNPEYPSGEFFNHAVKPEHEKASLEAIKNNLTDEHIDSIINEVGLDQKHADVIKQKKALLLSKYQA